MIQIGNPNQAVEPAVFDAPGGFAWWYVDVITPEGDGLVLIWSYGLPFLPGYAASARRGAGERPRARPSVNVAAYRRGREVFYLLQEQVPGAPPEAGVQQIGESRFTGGIQDGRFTLEATLDCPVPGSTERLRGTVTLQGEARRPVPAVDGDPRHIWTPLSAPATARVDLTVGARPVASFTGRAYHDRNTGLVPLHDLGIRRWMWGRIPAPDRESIFYLLWPHGGGPPRCIGLELGANGETHEVPEVSVLVEGARGAPWGLRLPRRLCLRSAGAHWLDLENTAVPERGPFYARFQTRAALGSGETALGWGELCEPDRVDQPWFRPLVRMRVQRATGRDSLWLPLFNGAREDRWRRLVRHAFGPRR